MWDLKLVVDLGNGFLKWTVFLEDEGKVWVIAREVQRTKWLRKGKILDGWEVIASLSQLIEKIKRKIGDDMISSVVVGLSHPYLKVERIKELTRILKPQVDNDNVQHLLRIVEDTVYRPNYDVVKIVPVYWIIDEELKVKDPVWLEAKRLELVADIFLLPKNLQDIIADIFAKVDLEVIDIVPNILAASEVALDIDSKDLGTLLVDIGHNQTSFVVWEEWYPLLWWVIPIWAEEVTKDISIGLQVDLQEAEKIKLQKATLGNLSKNIDDSDTLDMKFLREIVEARYEEIFEKINEQLREIDKEGRLPWGVFLIGWGAKIEWIIDFAKSVLKLAVFEWKDKQLWLSEISNDIMFVNSIGVYMWSQKYWWEAGGFVSFFKSGLFSGIGGFFKKLFKNLF